MGLHYSVQTSVNPLRIYTHHQGRSIHEFRIDGAVKSINNHGRYKQCISKAIELADLIKGDPAGQDLELSTPFADYPEPMLVAPQAANAGALSIDYPKGYSDYTPSSYS
ncbi:hypothetical protein OSG_eHP40_00085 [environmental Halophage eHP-40]|nr:hypothetical protein OSG_eHP40_00085 [environmental Halophage eHP-40]